MRLKIQVVGSIDDAVDVLGFWRDLLDLKHICFFFDYPGHEARGHRRADAPHGRRGAPAPGRAGAATPAARPGPAGLTPWAVGAAPCSSGESASPTARTTDVGIDGPSGTIAAVGPDLTPEAGGTTVDLGGYLLLPAPVEPHAHLDKAFLAERIANPSGDLLGAIEAMQAGRHTLTADDIADRAERAIRLLVANGVTAIRSHADTMVGHGLRSVEGLVEARRRVGDLVDLQIVALVSWPVTGMRGRRSPSPPAGGAGRRRRRGRGLPAPGRGSRRGQRGAAGDRGRDRPQSRSPHRRDPRPRPSSVSGTWPPG